MENPLIQKFTTPPFSKIENSHFKPSFKKAIELAKQEVNEIINNKESANFENTIEALEFSGELLSNISSIFFNLNSAETNDEIQQIAQEISPWLSEFKNDIILNEDLFKKVKQVYDQREALLLNQEQSQLLDKHYQSFYRNGALLNEEKKAKLREIDEELSKKSLQYGQNLLKDSNAFELLLTEEEVEGLPESAKQNAKSLATQKEKQGFLITLDYPSYIPFMKYAKNRELRKKLAIAFGSKGFQENENNNEQLIIDIVSLRKERAQLLGYDNHAHYTLERRMAKSATNVYSFLNDLLTKAKPAAEKEFEELQAYAKKIDGIKKLEKWDSAYYSEKLKHELFNIDDELLKPYFELKKVEAGVFEVAKKLFGLEFKKNTSVEKYHQEVTAYDVFDKNGNYKALFYTDYHPREGKRAGAWMTSYRSQKIKNGINERPQISIVCNFTKASSNTPSLLTFNEVTTLFHEFGHALHGILANTTYPCLSGTSVFWDFVELPSQIMENWCFEKEALHLFAKHYQTGELLPMEYVEKIKASSTFQEGMATLRQLSFGLLDMAWHTNPEFKNSTVKEFEKIAFSNTQLFPDVAENCMSTSFAHIFQGGYSSGYYSYKWAEVLDADAFSLFQEKGIFNTKIAEKFQSEILEKGGTEHPSILYKRFRGKQPTNEALLKRAGLL